MTSSSPSRFFQFSIRAFCSFIVRCVCVHCFISTFFWLTAFRHNCKFCWLSFGAKLRVVEIWSLLSWLLVCLWSWGCVTRETRGAQMTMEKCRTAIWLSFASIRKWMTHPTSQHAVPSNTNQTKTKKKCEIVRAQNIYGESDINIFLFAFAQTSMHVTEEKEGYANCELDRWCRCLNNNVCDIHFESSIHFLRTLRPHTTSVTY